MLELRSADVSGIDILFVDMSLNGFNAADVDKKCIDLLYITPLQGRSSYTGNAFIAPVYLKCCNFATSLLYVSTAPMQNYVSMVTDYKAPM